MGEVYRAHDNKLGRDVAIKTLPFEFAGNAGRLTRFRREARSLASLNHPNIAVIYGLEESEDVECLVLELVEGETLHGPLPVAIALDRARQLAEALEAAHETGIVHRDLKPANVMVTARGRVKVLDFGLAKAIWRVETGPELSHTAVSTSVESMAGQIVGTPGYMSPEQARGGEAQANPKCGGSQSFIWSGRRDLLSSRRRIFFVCVPRSARMGRDCERRWSNRCSHRAGSRRTAGGSRYGLHSLETGQQPCRWFRSAEGHRLSWQ